MIFEGSVYHLASLNDKNDLDIRVLWISEDRSTLVVVDISDSKNMEFPFFLSAEDLVADLQEDRAEKLDYEPDQEISNPANVYLEKHIEKRDRRWELIRDIVEKEPEVYYKEDRWQFIKDAMIKHNVKENVIYDALKRYWFYGKNINGLLNNFFDCGAKGESREYNNTRPGRKSDNTYILNENDFNNFKEAVEEFIINQRMNLRNAHQKLLETYYKKPGYRKRGVIVPIIIENESPSERQFTYWYRKNYSFKDRKSHRIGRRNAEKKFRPLLSSNSVYIEGPGALYQIDSTPSDLDLVSIDERTPIGRPTTFIVKDVFSRLIVGFFASIKHASWIEGAMMALENASANKVEFCQRYGITITEDEWPAYNLPREIVADRGEMKSHYPNGIVPLGVKIANTPSYRPDLKAVIEQQFKITNDMIKRILARAGAIMKNKREPGDSDPSDTAAITLDTFNKIMIEHILAFNKSSLPVDFLVTPEMFAEGVELTPNSLWNWGKKKMLLHERSKPIIHYALLPKGNAKVTRFGIEFKKLCYSCELGEEAGWFESELIEGEKNVTIAFDPRNCSQILIQLQNAQIEYCQLTPKFMEFDGLFFEDVKAIFDFRSKQYKGQSNADKQTKAEFNAITSKLIKDDVKATKEENHGKNKAEIRSNRREKRNEEAKKRSAQSALTNDKPINTEYEQPESKKPETASLVKTENPMSEFLKSKTQSKMKEMGL